MRCLCRDSVYSQRSTITHCPHQLHKVAGAGNKGSDGSTHEGTKGQCSTAGSAPLSPHRTRPRGTSCKGEGQSAEVKGRVCVDVGVGDERVASCSLAEDAATNRGCHRVPRDARGRFPSSTPPQECRLLSPGRRRQTPGGSGTKRGTRPSRSPPRPARQSSGSSRGPAAATVAPCPAAPGPTTATANCSGVSRTCWAEPVTRLATVVTQNSSAAGRADAQ